MILVKTKIAPSKIHGIGLFADQFIPKGTIIWKFQYPDLKLDKREIKKISEPAKQQFLNYSYVSSASNKYIFMFDDSRFFNHSNNPNCLDSASPNGDIEGITVAARDIEPGEELTCDYGAFDAEHDGDNL